MEFVFDLYLCLIIVIIGAADGFGGAAFIYPFSHPLFLPHTSISFHLHSETEIRKRMVFLGSTTDALRMEMIAKWMMRSE